MSLLLKLSRPLICFDLETTGKNIAEDKILYIAAMKFHPSGKESVFTKYVNPGIPISSGATEIHKIRSRDVEDSPPFEEIVDEFDDFIAGFDFIGYNLKRFDVPLLQAEYTRFGRTLDISNRSIIDSYEIFQTEEPKDLTAALKFYTGQFHKYAHKALEDVKATVKVFNAQLGRYDLPQSVEEIALQYPREVGNGEFIQTVNGVRIIVRGKHEGLTLDEVYIKDPSYVTRYIIVKSDLPCHIKEEARECVERNRLRAAG